MRAVLAHPATLVHGAIEGRESSKLVDTDQRMVISVISRHARLLATQPSAIAREGHCFPTARSYTLGEHMFGCALRAAVPFAITGDPVVAYNVMMLVSLWIAGIAMYALSFHYTGSPPAAFVAGLLFAFSNSRLSDPAHPYLSGGDLWAPLALLLLHRLLTEGSWRSALGFALFMSLLIGESLYTLVSSSMLVAVVGIYLVARDPGRLRAVAPKIAVAAALIGLVAWLVFGPYLATASTWDAMRRESSRFTPLSGFRLGNGFFPGTVVMLLAVLALLDRLRGARRRRGYDPRLIFLFAGLIVVWSSTDGVAPFGVRLPSPLALARSWVPGLDAVRVLGAVRVGAYLVAAFLAGYGVLAVVERLGRRGAVVGAGAIGLLGLLEVGSAGFATFSFGRPVPVEARRIRPDQSDLELVERTAEGAVLDLPNVQGHFGASAEQLLLSGFHQRPSSACYNSFRTPIQGQISRMAMRLPSRQVVDELAALGFRTLYVHRTTMLWGRNARLPALIARAAMQPGSGITALGGTKRIDAYRLAAPAAAHSDVAALAPPEPIAGEPLETTLVPPRSKVSLPIRNRAGTTFVHPEPFAPSDLVVTWRRMGGGEDVAERVRALLPLAIASGATADLELELDVPAIPGRYELTVARASPAGTPVARAQVRVAG